MIKEEIRKEIERVINPENNCYYTIEQPPKGINADIATNLPLVLAKKNKENPENIANFLISKFKDSYLFSSIEFYKPGFLNFRISNKRLYSELMKILEEQNDYPCIENKEPKNILIEFVSANPTGPLHIGHGRGAAIGDTLARILKKLGHNVTKEYYINDTGNQIYNLGKSVKYRILKISGISVEPSMEKWFIESGYRGSYIEDIAKNIIKNENLDNENIQKKDEYFYGNYASRIIMEGIKEDLYKFNVSFDNWFSEKSLYENDYVNKTLSILSENGFTYEKDDALWFKSTIFGDDKDRVLIRKNEKETYFANDISYHRNKYERGFNLLIDIWGADHHGYVQRLKSAVRCLNKEREEPIIILYQLVSLLRSGKPVAMSTRAGEFITLREVLQEIGPDATRYFLLTRSPESHLEFDLELAKKTSSENPVFYVQYAHTRCCGILRSVEKTIPNTNHKIRTNFYYLNNELEHELMRKLLFFPETIMLCGKNFSPHYITVYLLELANIFHRYYETTRILGNDMEVTDARLKLISCIKIVLKNGLNLLGLNAPEKM